MYKQIILDTNFLLAVYQFRIDIFSELERVCDFPFELCIIDKTIDELNHIIERQKGKDKEAALFALNLINKKNISIIKTEKNTNVDDLILNLIKNKDCIVATQDKNLKRKLKGTQVLVIKQKKYLLFV
jgi:hypothetical protein